MRSQIVQNWCFRFLNLTFQQVDYFPSNICWETHKPGSDKRLTKQEVTMIVTTLIENKPSKTDSHLVSEWGLSLHITFNDYGILFDTGTSGSFAKNAERLSVNVASVNTAAMKNQYCRHWNFKHCQIYAWNFKFNGTIVIPGKLSAELGIRPC